MDFVTLGYYYWFLPITMALYFALLKGKQENRIILLVIMSYIFFFLSSGWYFILLAVSTCTDWIAGKRISVSDDISVKKRWLYASLSINLGLLAVFKYLDFFIESLNLITLKLPSSPEISTLGLILPVGISFYTFQTMSYTIDIYRGSGKPYDKFTDFACYASFFPQLVAGPIVRSQEFIEQINKPREFSISRTRLGLTLIVYGLFKKIIIADNVAVHVNEIFAEGAALDNTALVWWGALCFGIQIYCDFSGYTDIALGSAHLMSIELPENFKTPYAATSPRDFWRRWHISLSTWLRDYLYIPLGGSRNGNRKLALALMATMILGGLWHGASWNFAIWGFLHGILLLGNRVLASNNLIISGFYKFPKIMTGFGWLVTQFSIFFTWLVFRIEDTTMLFRSMKSFIGIDAYWDLDELLSSLPYIKVTTAIMVFSFIILHGISGYVGSGKYWLARRNPFIWGIICGTALGLCVILRPIEAADFIYFRF